ILIPILWTIYASFKTQNAISNVNQMFSLKGFTLGNYKGVLSTNTGIPLYIVNSFITASSVTLISLFAGITGGYSFSRFKIRGSNFLLLIIFGAQMFPGVLLLIPLYNLLFAYHLVNTLLGIVIVQSTLVIPLSVWLLKGFFDGIPKEIDEAAIVDGGGLWRTLLYVIIPMSMPGIIVAGFYSFVVSWGDFVMASVVVGSNSTTTLSLGLEAIARSSTTQWGYVDVGATFALLPTLVLFAVFQRWIVKGLVEGAIK
ncbi:MAG: carbohydrate ABC transporter permease, partial [Nitrososphaeria archaeon]